MEKKEIRDPDRFALIRFSVNFFKYNVFSHYSMSVCVFSYMILRALNLRCAELCYLCENIYSRVYSKVKCELHSLVVCNCKNIQVKETVKQNSQQQFIDTEYCLFLL
jgi:hypothetical protein